MSDAAHPQPDADARAKKLHAATGPRGEDHAQAWDEAPEALRDKYREMAGAEPAAAENPFPTAMTVPGLDGQPVRVELVVIDGVVYAPELDQLPLAALVRQYVTQYCAAWSSSVLFASKLDAAQPEPARRAQLRFTESQLHAMLGLAADERLVNVIVDQDLLSVRFVVDSPRLPRKYWDSPPPFVRLPLAAYYEQGVGQ